LLGSGTAFAQGDSWDARESGELSVTVPGGRTRPSLETKMNTEKRCPPGDWDQELPEDSWNVIELGVAIDTPTKLPADTEPRLYSRYTCQRPMDRP
jgi:hypothetical protein